MSHIPHLRLPDCKLTLEMFMVHLVSSVSYRTVEGYSCTCELLMHCILTWVMVVRWLPLLATSMCPLISDTPGLWRSLSIICPKFTSLRISRCCFSLRWTSPTLSLLCSGWLFVQPGLASCAWPMFTSLLPDFDSAGHVSLLKLRPRSTNSIHLLCYSPLRPIRLIFSKSIYWCLSFSERS